ncbi:unnamed protein product [Discosporangium mesarthrocarpum]
MCASIVLSSVAIASAFVAPMNTLSTQTKNARKRSRPSMSTEVSPEESVSSLPEEIVPPAIMTGPQYLATLPGSGPPLGIFDPLDIASKFRAIDVKKFRESEVKHGRVALLAFVGMMIQELGHPLYDNGSDIGPAILHLQAIEQDFPLAPLALFCFVGVLEANNIYVGWNKQPIKEGIADLKDMYEPGDLGFDPLGLMPKDPAGQMAMKTKELNNGRLAMLAVVGVWAQELVDGKTVLGHLFG